MQIAALSAVSNVVLDFTPHKSVFFQCGGVDQLIQLARSMDSMLRLNAVWALRNLLYLADMSVKEKVMAELTVSTLISLIQGTLIPTLLGVLYAQSVSVLKTLRDAVDENFI